MAKKTTKKRTTKKPAAAKPAAKSAGVKIGSADKPRTKSELYGLLAEGAGIGKKEVAAVFDTLQEVIKKDLAKTGPGAVNLAGLMKVTVTRKPATKARKGINPFTGEPTTFAAKPARNVVKVRPMKSLKDLV